MPANRGGLGAGAMWLQAWILGDLPTSILSDLFWWDVIVLVVGVPLLGYLIGYRLNIFVSAPLLHNIEEHFKIVS